MSFKERKGVFHVPEIVIGLYNNLDLCPFCQADQNFLDDISYAYVSIDETEETGVTMTHKEKCSQCGRIAFFTFGLIDAGCEEEE